jgi:hypothetical protein
LATSLCICGVPVLRRDSVGRWYSKGSMERIKTKLILLAFGCLAGLCASLQGQTVHQYSPTAPKEKAIQDKERPMPFAIDGKDSGMEHAVEFRPLDKMTARDREVAANAESSIGEHARYSGLEFNEGNWSYEQVVCSALPEHVFLRFMRNNGTGDVSLFTASIPRGNEGRVRIIPIQLRGYSLFSPAPINALTISAFNHIRAEENPDHAPVSGWLATGLCYGALAGGHPQLRPRDEDPMGQKVLAAKGGELEISERGGAVISFDDISAVPKPMQWSMTFDGKGRLLKATHTSAELLKISEAKPKPVNENGRVVADNKPQTNKLTPVAPAVVTVHPIPPPPPVKRVNPVPNIPPGKQAVPVVPQAGLVMRSLFSGRLALTA